MYAKKQPHTSLEGIELGRRSLAASRSASFTSTCTIVHLSNLCNAASDVFHSWSPIKVKAIMQDCNPAEIKCSYKVALIDALVMPQHIAASDLPAGCERHFAPHIPQPVPKSPAA